MLSASRHAADELLRLCWLHPLVARVCRLLGFVWPIVLIGFVESFEVSFQGSPRHKGLLVVTLLLILVVVARKAPDVTFFLPVWVCNVRKRDKL